MTIKALYPTVRPTLNLDFARTKALDPRVTFTRASTGTFVGADGLIKTAASGAPRFDHNPATGESLGLLVEEARTNLITYSEQFDNAAWTKELCSITANATTAPDGTATADKYVEGTSVYNLVSATTGSSATSTAYTATVYVKAAERSACYIRLAFTGNANWVGGKYDLINGVAQAVVGSLSTYTNASVSIQACSNGWWRISCTCTGSNMTPRWGAMDSYSTTLNAGSGVPLYTGNGTSGIFIWGAQLEAGTFPTSYIPTVASTVTRAADAASMTGTNFSSWYNQSQGTWLINFANDAAKQGAFRGVLSLGGNNTPRIQGNSVVGYGGSLSFTPTALTKAGLAYGSTEGRAVNGSVTSGAGGTIDIETYVDIGTGASSSPASYMLSTSIARLTYYPVRLPDAQLQALTAT